MRRHAALAVACTLSAASAPHARAEGHRPPPTLVLFTHDAGDRDDFDGLKALRSKLRDGGHFDVLTYDIEAPAVLRAAADAHHPEWTTTPVTTDADRLALSKALGASFYAVVTHTKSSSKPDIQFVDVLAPAHVWTVTDKKADAAADALAADATEAAAHRAVPSPAPTAPEIPLVVTPAPAPPVVVTPAPAPPVVAIPDAQQQTAREQAANETTQRQLAAVKPLLAKGDAALLRGEVAMAISLYRQAVDGAPRAAQPRLALARAYLQGGFRDKALDEAKRALQVSPDSVPIKEFLIGLDAENASSEGSVALYSALVEKDPEDVSAHIGLADAYWNDGSLDRAESEYKAALGIEATTGGHRGVTQLARMYGAQSRYADTLEMLAQLGATRYPLALSIIKSRADALLTGMSTERDSFEAKKSSHEQFYDTVKKVASDAQALVDFVGKVAPPPAFKLSHLHRQLAVNLIAQEAAVLMTYIETSDADQGDKAASLEKSAQSEMLTANAGEQKNGLSAEGN